MLGGLYLHKKERGRNRDQTVWYIPDLQTTQGKRGKKEVKDRDICTFRMKIGDLGLKYHPGLISSFNPCMQRRSKGGL